MQMNDISFRSFEGRTVMNLTINPLTPELATALLQRVIDDVKSNGYIAVEGFPVVRNERFEWGSAGPIRLYEKLGFIKVAEQDSRIVM